MEQDPRIILAGNGSYDNRGCEAIVRGTAEIIRHYYSNPSFLCVSSFNSKGQFIKQSIGEGDPLITHKKINRRQSKFDAEWLFYKSLGSINLNFYKHWIHKEILAHLSESQAILSVGGDNYSLDYGLPRTFTYLDDIVLKKRKPLVIWGASIGPFDKDPKYEKYMIKHLQDVTAIFARESATIEYLDRKGVTDNVYSTADPAFLMKPKKLNDKTNKIKEGAIGINLSPLMAKYVTAGNIEEWTKMAAEIVSLISKKTARTIYLIPHVTTSSSNDYLFLKNVLSKINNHEDKIILIPPIYSAPETKWIISKMVLFAGARTHSTIASLSSCVPTLSFAYSIKSKGINKDIFGHELYSLGPDSLKPSIVVEQIESMIENKNKICNHLSSKIPAIEKKALIAGKYLQEIMENK